VSRSGPIVLGTTDGVAFPDWQAKMDRMTQADIINTFIIGTDVVARVGLRTLLQISGRVTIAGEADGDPRAADQAARLDPDVVLLQARTIDPGLLRQLHDVARHAPVLLLADDESPTAVERAIQAGATGYLINGHYGPDELISAVLATAKNQPRLSPAAVCVLIHRLRNIRGRHEPAHGPQLSRREVEIVDHLVRGRTNAEIGRSLGISEKTVKNHVNHIYAKLHTRNRAETVALWLGPDPPPVPA
jgi:DNA-binding NarL/FixJ family response regulator